MAFGLSAATLGTIASVAVPAIGGLIGGHSSSGTQQGGTQTVNKDPWLPAQDWLKQNIANGQGYQAAYQASPFNGQQQAAYANLASGGDYINRMIPGLLSQMSQSTGFDRNNPTARPAAYNFAAPSVPPQMAHAFGGMMQPNVPGSAQGQQSAMPFLFQADAAPQNTAQTGMAAPLQAQMAADTAMDYRRSRGIGEFAGNSSN